MRPSLGNRAKAAYSSMLGTLAGGRAPRHWAADIAAGIASMDDVPEQWRELVQEYIDVRRAQIEFWVRHVLAAASRDMRRARLDQCPAGIRTEVAHTARRLWEQRQKQRK